MSILSVSIDLDEIDCYHAIHGIDNPSDSNVIYKRALPRALDFFEKLNIKATLFVVGKDLENNPEAITMLEKQCKNGHEIGNHTMNHRYDFTMLPLDEQENEISNAKNIINNSIGFNPVGFRAPGYNMNLNIIDILKKQNYIYDSSVFPCPMYYAAKAGVIGIKSLKGQRSSSLIGDPRILKAPTEPYKIGEEGLWTKGDGFKELPISVITKARLPFIGTALSMMGVLPAKLFAKQAARLPFINLELHGIDFIDADGDGLSYLKEYQSDMKIPLIRRRKILETVVKTILDKGHEAITLETASKRIFI